MLSLLLAAAVTLGCTANTPWNGPPKSAQTPATDRASFLFDKRPFQVRRMKFGAGNPTEIARHGWGLRYQGSQSVRHVWLLDGGDLPSDGALGRDEGLVISPVEEFTNKGRQEIPAVWRGASVGRDVFREQMRKNWLSAGLGNLGRQAWVESRVTSQPASDALKMLDPKQLQLAAAGALPGERPDSTSPLEEAGHAEPSGGGPGWVAVTAPVASALPGSTLMGALAQPAR
ncbi:MAG: hypothetical protein AAFZ65_18605, partial [Planctomycetota bacterium]